MLRFDPNKKSIIEKSHAYARSVDFPLCNMVLTPRITGANIFVEELGMPASIMIFVEQLGIQVCLLQL